MKQVNPKLNLFLVRVHFAVLTIGVQSVLIKLIVVDNMFSKVVIASPPVKKHNISIINFFKDLLALLSINVEFIPICKRKTILKHGYLVYP